MAKYTVQLPVDPKDWPPQVGSMIHLLDEEAGLDEVVEVAAVDLTRAGLRITFATPFQLPTPPQDEG